MLNGIWKKATYLTLSPAFPVSPFCPADPGKPYDSMNKNKNKVKMQFHQSSFVTLISI